jgi:hypothetical protein
VLLKLSPEDSIEAKISYCIDFFESEHTLSEHITVINFVILQSEEDPKFKESVQNSFYLVLFVTYFLSLKSITFTAM